MIIIFVILFLSLAIYWYLLKPKNLPSGPLDLPLIGYIPWLLYYKKNKTTLIKRLKLYGDVVTIRIGFVYIIILTELNSFRELLKRNSEDVIGCQLDFTEDGVHSFKRGVSSRFHETHLRQFLRQTLNNPSHSHQSNEMPVMLSVYGACEFINSHVGESVNVYDCLTRAVVDSVVHILIGDPLKSSELDSITLSLLRSHNIPVVRLAIEWLPLLGHLLKLGYFREMFLVDDSKKMKKNLDRTLRPHVKRCYMEYQEGRTEDALLFRLFEEQSREKSNEVHSEIWEEDQLVYLCSDLVISGVDPMTTLATLALLLLAGDRGRQDRLQRELDSVIGHRPPCTGDLDALPLCRHLLLHAARILPLTRESLENKIVIDNQCHVYDYSLPRGAFVVPFLTDTNHERVDDELTTNEECHSILQFTTRSCLGEPLARTEFIFFLASLLQRYNILPDPKYRFPDMENDLFFSIRHSRVIFSRRSED